MLVHNTHHTLQQSGGHRVKIRKSSDLQSNLLSSPSRVGSDFEFVGGSSQSSPAWTFRLEQAQTLASFLHFYQDKIKKKKISNNGYN